MNHNEHTQLQGLGNLGLELELVGMDEVLGLGEDMGRDQGLDVEPDRHDLGRDLDKVQGVVLDMDEDLELRV